MITYTSSRLLFLPSIVAVVTVLLTIFAWQSARTVVDQEAAEIFEEEIRLIENAITNRGDIYINALRAGNALFAASEFVDRDEWRAFAEQLELQKHFPGIQGFGFSQYIPRDEKDEHIEALRAEGFPGYTIRPIGERAEYTAIIYLEPFDERNQQAFGFDMFSETTRREAMSRARDTGEPHLSGRVTLVQEIDEDVQAGFLIYVPTYTNGMAHETEIERQEALLGYVYSPFRAKDFMTGIINPEDAFIDFAVFDGDVREENRLYDSALVYRNFDALEGSDEAFTTTRTITIANRTWTIYFSNRPAFIDTFVSQQQPLFILIGGLLMSALLTVVVYVLAFSRRRAITLAEEMVSDLKQKSDENERIQKELQKANTVLETQKETLSQKVADLEKMTSTMTERELKMMELKKKLSQYENISE